MSGKNGKTGKGLLVGAGALVLALGAAWLGIDGTGSGDGGDAGTAANGRADQNQSQDQDRGNGGNRNGGNGDAGNRGDDGNISAGADVCSIDTLPEEADDGVYRILTNQDHIYAVHDGKHFGNYEGLLPNEHGSYYREYTVDTPGLNHRGARRIVVGGGTEDDPDVWYYTDDHYESFCEIPDAED